MVAEDVDNGVEMYCTNFLLFSLFCIVEGVYGHFKARRMNLSSSSGTAKLALDLPGICICNVTAARKER